MTTKKMACRLTVVALLVSQPLIGFALTLAYPKPNDGERLSDYLIRQKLTGHDFLFGMVLQTPATLTQQQTRHRLLRLALSDVPNELQIKGVDPKVRQRLVDFVSRNQPTGRVVLPSADARWLQVNPDRDPVLSSEDRLFLADRPETVGVLRSDGKICQVQHLADVEALDYVKACEEKPEVYIEGYLIQPDGRIEQIQVGAWNRAAQSLPAPGAWVWMPAIGDQWPKDFSWLLSRFLAAQGPFTEDMDSLAPTMKVKITKKLTNISKRSRDAVISAGDWGITGLLQTPTARLPKAGYASIGFSKVEPYTHLNVMLSPFDWLEFGFRYTDIGDALYGPQIAGNQSYKDKSIEAKFRLFEESRFIPQVAVGLRDIGGTGLFSGEYAVANKRFGDFDLSLGLGWSYLGARGNLKNPLGLIHDGFNTRPSGFTGFGGTFAFKNYFRGPTALFGGVQYHTPWDKWKLKIEYDGNDYQSEPFSKRRTVNSPINFAAVYSLGKGSFLTLGVERGNTAVLGLTFGSDYSKFDTPKVNDPRKTDLLSIAPVFEGNVFQANWEKINLQLYNQVGWRLLGADRRQNEIRLMMTDVGGEFLDQRIERANRILHAELPAEIDEFTYVLGQRGVELTEVTVKRKSWAARHLSYVPPEHGLQGSPHDLLAAYRMNALQLESEVHKPANYETRKTPKPLSNDEPIVRGGEPKVLWGTGISYSQMIGGPDGFVIYGVSAYAETEVRIRPDTWIFGGLNLNILDNYAGFVYDAPSLLPRVRTNIREYKTSSRVTMPVLQINHMRQFSDHWLGLAYAGYLEYSYAGVGGEVLYRPDASRWAMGLDVNKVQQRDFDQRWGLRDYKVDTGHATLYWDTGWNNVNAKISVGQYLAGDKGVTVDLSRRFNNGVEMGVFATKTNVSAQQFGEGSFDKGIYLTIPFDVLLTKSTGGSANFIWNPLTRDGGAKLKRSVPLFELTRLRDPAGWRSRSTLSQ
jgi:hypothetical protein